MSHHRDKEKSKAKNTENQKQYLWEFVGRAFFRKCLEILHALTLGSIQGFAEKKVLGGICGTPLLNLEEGVSPPQIFLGLFCLVKGSILLGHIKQHTAAPSSVGKSSSGTSLSSYGIPSSSPSSDQKPNWQSRRPLLDHAGKKNSSRKMKNATGKNESKTP